MIAKLCMVNVAIVILAFALTNVKAEYDVEKYCQLVPRFTKLPSFDSCKSYYVCKTPNKPTKEDCPNNQVFNKDKGACEPEKDSNCKYGAKNPCTGKDEGFATDLENCRMWHYCKNGESQGSGTCLTGQYFNGEMCVNGKCPYDYVGKSSATTEVRNICNIMKVGLFFGDFDNCATWRKCFVDKPIQEGQCDKDHTGYVFDVQVQACSPYGKAICERTGGVTTENGHQDTCKADDTYGDSNVCSNYYKCISGKWTLSQCQNNQYYDTVTKKCVDRQKATPVNTCDRCQFTYSKWVNAVDSKCSKFLTCKDGKKVSEGSCGTNSYFNEQTQVCLAGTSNLPNYVKDNGACKCDLQCQLEECTNKKCRETLCADKNDPECYCVNNPTELKCQLETCKDDNDCKQFVCTNHEDTDECKCVVNPNQLECKLESCKDTLQCKVNICKLNENKNNDKCKCILNPELVECKLEDCTNKYSNDPAKANNCKLNLLNSCKTDTSCKKDVCLDDSIKDTEECKIVNCETNDTKSKKIECISNICNENNAGSGSGTNADANADSDAKKKCIDRVCDNFSADKEDKAFCKVKLCDTDDECKEEFCENTSLESTVSCKIVDCKGDAACKFLVCKNNKDAEECKTDNSVVAP